MKIAPVFAAYCLLVLMGYGVARYQGWTLFGVSGRAATGGSTGTRPVGYAGYHK